METGDKLGLLGMIFSVISISTLVTRIYLFGYSQLLLTIMFFIVFIIAILGLILSICGIAKNHSKFGIIGLPISSLTLIILLLFY